MELSGTGKAHSVQLTRDGLTQIIKTSYLFCQVESQPNSAFRLQALCLTGRPGTEEP
jgi:hypothetical protein